VAVADGEGVGQRVVEGQVRACVVAHRERAVVHALGDEVLAHEAVHPAAVPTAVLRPPVVREVVGALAVGARVEMERQQPAAVARDGVARLGEGGASGRVVEPAHAAIGAEVVVEGPVLLDEDDDVVDVGQMSAPRRRGQRIPERVRRMQSVQRRGGRGAGAQ